MDLNPKYRYNNTGAFATLASTGLEAAAKYLHESKEKRERSRELKRARDARYRERRRGAKRYAASNAVILNVLGL